MKLPSALFITSILLLTACSNSTTSVERRSKQTARFNIHSEPPSLDPRKATDTTSISVIRMCFEGLMRLGQGSAPELALANQVLISEDGKSYTFTLREASWSDGTPITAMDFEKSWKTILDPSFPSEIGLDLYILKNAKAAREGKLPLDQVGVKAVDARTLQVELSYPHPHFLLMVTSHTFLPVPSHIPEAYPNWAENEKHYVSSGPFKLKEWKHYNQITLEKNPDYWDAQAVKLNEIQLAIIEDENTELAMFENGELDWAGSPLSQLPIDALPTLMKKKEVNLYDLSGVYYFIFNTREFPFNNVKMRRAFSLAINRQAIIENVTQGRQKPATSLIPPSMWKEEISYFKDADITEARRLFAEALKELNITKSELPSLALSYNTSAAHHKIAQAIQQQWVEAFGVQVHLENKEWKVFLDEVYHHQFQIARMGGIAAINDPADFLEASRYYPSSRNQSQWYSPRYAALMDKSEQTKDAETRKAILREAEKILIEEMPIAPIYFYTGAFLKKPYLKDVFVSELSELDLKHAYLEKE
ncbi:MAG: peptide ABC transporter substrate-binding protein [Chlamydiales bacterium]|nr:peptide ABC transporter substrate-binding protein [Chlamydiales bacterium]